MTTVRTGNARLLRLAAFLRTLPPKRFDYTVWVGDDWQGDPTLSCGTTACALGWATTIPSLRRAGLRLAAGPYAGTAEVVLRGQTYETGESIGSGMAVFGLAEEEACDLFAPGPQEGGATPKQVAAKIERFVKGRVSG